MIASQHAAQQPRRRLLAVALVACALLLPFGAAHAGQLQLGDRPALPTVRTIDNQQLDLANLRGKVLVLAYFASYCPFCMNEAPKLQKLYRENSGKVMVIGVNIETADPQQLPKARQWVEKYQLTHPVTTDFKALEKVLGRLKGLPVNQVFDADGKVVRIDIGEIFDEDFDDIARLAR